MNTEKLKKWCHLLALVASLALSTGLKAGDDEEMAFEGKRAYLGVYVESVPALVSSQLNLDEGVGVVVQKIVKDSPAEKAGVKQHDILLKFDDQILIGTKQIVVLVRNSDIGSEHEIIYLRGGKETTATVVLGETEYKKKKHVEEQSFYHIPTAPMAPVAPVPSVHGSNIREEQQRALEAIVMAQEEIARVAESNEMRALNGEDFNRTMELSEEIEVLLERVNRASQGAQNVTMPTIVFSGPERVFEFSDAEGQRFVIVEKDGEQQLSVIDSEGKQSYNGPLDEEARKLLPEGLKKKLPEIHRIVQVSAPVWTPAPDVSVETF